MTSQEMISLVRSGLKQVGKLRYKTGTTTSAGVAGGTTFVSTSFGGVDDAWNNAEIRITSGDNAGQRREIGDWVNSTGTGTLIEAFTHQVATSVTFEVGEKGFVSDHQIIEWLSAGQLDIGNKLPTDAFIEKLVTREKDGVSGVAPLPTDIIGVPHSVKVGGRVAFTVSPDKENMFTDDPFLPGTTNRPVGLYKGGNFHYRPANNVKVAYEAIPLFTNFTFTDGSQLPAYLHKAQCKYAIWQGWVSKEKDGLATISMNEYLADLQAISAKFAFQAELG